MSRNYYNRYTRFVINEVTKPLPFLTIDPKSTDKTVVYNSDRDRLDKFSQQIWWGRRKYTKWGNNKDTISVNRYYTTIYSSS